MWGQEIGFTVRVAMVLGFIVYVIERCVSC
jgi:hypothetical protein